MPSEKIGEIVLLHRKRSGLSRVQLALLAGVGKTAIYDIEHGKLSIRLTTLLKVLHVLNISLSLTGPYTKEFENEKS